VTAGTFDGVRVAGRGFRVAADSLASHRESQLRHSTDADGQNNNRAGQSSRQQRHRNGYVAAGGKELDANVARVLRDEVDQRDAEEYRHSDRHPRR